MSGVILDGKKIRDEILSELRPRIEVLRQRKRAPALAVVLVGDDPASQIYVRGKIKACHELGIRSLEVTPPGDISTDDLIQAVVPLTRDDSIDGILIQKPLPKQVDEEAMTRLVDASRDVDGFGVHSLGCLVLNKPAPRACTPAGIMELLKRYKIAIAGKHAVVVGRSDIVGKPMALMLLHENATVTVCHSRTKNLAEECRRADILVAAIGKAALITAEHIKPGAVVIDVGMNRLSDEAEVQRLFRSDAGRLAAFAKNGSTLVGDVEPRAMQELSSAYTPVPGGVGPLTIAMLMANTVQLAEQHIGVKPRIQAFQA
jgi:methylenetetrahydrofolate dehydrogenase (NADP+)/methenyltetrahydrofolate cyclohydrolase